MRQTLGTAVFAGMLGVTFFGIFLTPVFYVAARVFGRRKTRRVGPDPLRSFLLFQGGCAVL